MEFIRYGYFPVIVEKVYTPPRLSSSHAIAGCPLSNAPPGIPLLGEFQFKLEISTAYPAATIVKVDNAKVRK
jgi:hypothetical protein